MKVRVVFSCVSRHTRLIVLVMGSGNEEVDIIRETGRPTNQRHLNFGRGRMW